MGSGTSRICPTHVKVRFHNYAFQSCACGISLALCLPSSMTLIFRQVHLRVLNAVASLRPPSVRRLHPKMPEQGELRKLRPRRPRYWSSSWRPQIRTPNTTVKAMTNHLSLSLRLSSRTCLMLHDFAGLHSHIRSCLSEVRSDSRGSLRKACTRLVQLHQESMQHGKEMHGHAFAAFCI